MSPSPDEIEAAAKAMGASDDWAAKQWDGPGPPKATYYRYAEAALIAAEKLRMVNEANAGNAKKAKAAAARIREARTQGIHTCHSECPCQTGGKPMPDFVEAQTQAEGNHTNHEGTPEPEPDDNRTPKWSLETGCKHE